MIPTLEYKVDGTTLSYRWATVVPGFDMQLPVALSGDQMTLLHPTEAWQTAPTTVQSGTPLTVDRNYYVVTKNVGP
jgi:hypothetical protein